MRLDSRWNEGAAVLRRYKRKSSGVNPLLHEEAKAEQQS